MPVERADGHQIIMQSILNEISFAYRIEVLLMPTTHFLMNTKRIYIIGNGNKTAAFPEIRECIARTFTLISPLFMEQGSRNAKRRRKRNSRSEKTISGKS